MSESRVFVVQQPATYDRDARTFIPKYDLQPASRHGKLVFLLKPGNVFRDRLDEARKTLSEKLANFSKSDYLLAVGDPVAIAAAVLIAGERTGGVVNLLKWDRMRRSYESFEISTR